MPSATDPYSLLGVDRDSDEVDIKAAYRSLILQLHPDVNPAPEAIERVKRITEAYRQISELRQDRTSIWNTTRQEGSSDEDAVPVEAAPWTAVVSMEATSQPTSLVTALLATAATLVVLLGVVLAINMLFDRALTPNEPTVSFFQIDSGPPVPPRVTQLLQQIATDLYLLSLAPESTIGGPGVRPESEGRVLQVLEAAARRLAVARAELAKTGYTSTRLKLLSAPEYSALAERMRKRCVGRVPSQYRYRTRS